MRGAWSRTKNIIIDIPFNIDLSHYLSPKNYIHPKLKKSFEVAQTSAWIERRMALFMKYTATSLIQQTNQDFLCLVRCSVATEKMIKEVLKGYKALPPHMLFTPEAQEIIQASMAQQKNVYRVVIDSDNMYAPDFIDKLQNFRHEAMTQTLLCREGFVYDEGSGILASIHHPSPSFYAAIYNEQTYALLYERRLFEKHWDVLKYPYEVMEGKNYCICTHNQNVDNDFGRIIAKYKGVCIEGIEKEGFLKAWHIKE